MNSKPALTLALLLALSSGLLAQARLEITSPVSLNIDHGAVEVELEHQVMVTVKNANLGGGAPLDGSLSFVAFSGNPADACPSCVYWTFVGSNTFNLAANTSAVFTIKFKPDVNAAVGNHGIKLRVTSTNSSGHIYTDSYDDSSTTADDNTLDVDIIVNGQASKTTINYSLVLDRSGSMSAVECSKTRIDILGESAALFFDLAKLRKQDLPAFDGDSIGLVKFDDIVNADYLPRSAVTDALITQAKTLLNPAAPDLATTTASKIQPRGLTAIGPAVIDALNIQLPEISLPNTKKVVILFSDGYENVAPYTYQPAVTNLLLDRQDVNIYTIGMGDADDAALQTLSLNSGLVTAQYYGFPNYATTCDPYMLANFYFKIYQNAIGLASVVDPTYYVSLQDTTTRVISSAMVTSSDKKAVFVVLDPPPYRSFYKLEVVSPKGELLSTGTLTAGLTVKQIADLNYTIYEVNFSQTTDPTSYVGKWDLKIIPQIAGPQANRSKDISPIPIGFSVSTFSNLKMELNGVAAGNEPGNELVVSVDLIDAGLPVKNVINHQAVLTTPSGKEVTLTLIADPFGKLVARYPHTFEAGLYKIFVRTRIANAKGEITTREDTKYTVIENKRQVVPPQDRCISCLWIWVIVIAVILLLFLIILLIRRRT